MGGSQHNTKRASGSRVARDRRARAHTRPRPPPPSPGGGPLRRDDRAEELLLELLAAAAVGHRHTDGNWRPAPIVDGVAVVVLWSKAGPPQPPPCQWRGAAREGERGVLLQRDARGEGAWRTCGCDVRRWPSCAALSLTSGAPAWARRHRARHRPAASSAPSAPNTPPCDSVASSSEAAAAARRRRAAGRRVRRRPPPPPPHRRRGCGAGRSLPSPAPRRDRARRRLGARGARSPARGVWRSCRGLNPRPRGRRQRTPPRTAARSPRPSPPPPSSRPEKVGGRRRAARRAVGGRLVRRRGRRRRRALGDRMRPARTRRRRARRWARRRALRRRARSARSRAWLVVLWAAEVAGVDDGTWRTIRLRTTRRGLEGGEAPERAVQSTARRRGRRCRGGVGAAEGSRAQRSSRTREASRRAQLREQPERRRVDALDLAEVEDEVAERAAPRHRPLGVAEEAGGGALVEEPLEAEHVHRGAVFVEEPLDGQRARDGWAVRERRRWYLSAFARRGGGAPSWRRRGRR